MKQKRSFDKHGLVSLDLLTREQCAHQIVALATRSRFQNALAKRGHFCVMVICHITKETRKRQQKRLNLCHAVSQLALILSIGPFDVQS